MLTRYNSAALSLSPRQPSPKHHLPAYRGPRASPPQVLAIALPFSLTFLPWLVYPDPFALTLVLSCKP